MKALVAVGEHAWLDPNAVDALVTVPQGTLVVLSSGEHITLPGMAVDDVLEAFENAMKEVADDSWSGPQYEGTVPRD